MNTLELLNRLIAFPTVSRDPNRELIEFVRQFLAERGIGSDLYLTEDGRKANLFATIGPADKPGVMLSGHTDVVPVDGQNWSKDAFRMTVADEKAYGRGATDMKGFLACALRVAERATARPLWLPLQLAFSYDEEVGCLGVRSLIDDMADWPHRPRFCIVGEPTQLRIAIGHKGKTALKATFMLTTSLMEDQARTLSVHKAVLDCIRFRDTAGARNAMNRLLDVAAEDLVRR